MSGRRWWWMNKDEREVIRRAAEALRVFNGHDSGANLRHRYGEKWWEAITKLERDLQTLRGQKP